MSPNEVLEGHDKPPVATTNNYDRPPFEHHDSSCAQLNLLSKNIHELHVAVTIVNCQVTALLWMAIWLCAVTILAMIVIGMSKYDEMHARANTVLERSERRQSVATDERTTKERSHVRSNSDDTH